MDRFHFLAMESIRTAKMHFRQSHILEELKSKKILWKIKNDISLDFEKIENYDRLNIHHFQKKLVTFVAEHHNAIDYSEN